MEMIWGAFSYVAAVFVAVLLAEWQHPKKDRFAIRAICAFVIVFGMLLAYDRLIDLVEGDTLHFILNILDCLVVFFGVLAVMGMCFSADFWVGLFCTTVGYCMQHMTKVLSDLIGIFIGIDQWWMKAVVLTLVTVICYWLIYVFVLKRRRGEYYSVDSALQTIMSVAVILLSMVFYLVSMRLIRGTEKTEITSVIIKMFSFMIALETFFFEFGLLFKRKMTEENKAIMHLLAKESQQYQMDREKMERINIKCHDLKEHIAYLKELPASGDREKYINDLQQDVSNLGQMIKTGNSVLDMLLSEKQLICEQNKIKLSFMVDGDNLKVMEGLDIYSLFGNAINNAIEYLKSLEDEEKRLLTVKVYVRNQFLCVNFENYFEGEIQLEDDLPRTTKTNRDYHGFGLKSMKHIVDKYRGEMVIDYSGRVFSIGITIPIMKNADSEIA